MENRELISTRFIFGKFVFGFLSVSASVFLIVDFYNNSDFEAEFEFEKLVLLISIWLLSGLFYWFTKSIRNIEFDGEKLFLIDRKSKSEEVIELQKVSSVVFSAIGINLVNKFSYRLFYTNKNGLNKMVRWFPSDGFLPSKLIDKIKKKNPNVVVTNMGFGFEEFFRNEKWFR